MSGWQKYIFVLLGGQSYPSILGTLAGPHMNLQKSCILKLYFYNALFYNVLKAWHLGFTPHAKGGRKGPNVDHESGGFELRNPC